MKQLFSFLIFWSVAFPAFSQKLEYLNKHKYVIGDTSKFAPFFYRVTIEDSLQKSIRTYSMDSSLVYQFDKYSFQKNIPFPQVEIWYFDSGEKETVISSNEKKGKIESIEYYESGGIKSLKVEKNLKSVSEKYYSENGEKIPKPEIESALPDGGLEGWTIYLSQNLIYPLSARKAGFEGLVYLFFIINEEGKMEDIEVMNPEENHFLLNQEALRVTKAYPYLWTPCKIDGKVQKSKMRLPIRFKLT